MKTHSIKKRPERKGRCLILKTVINNHKVLKESRARNTVGFFFVFFLKRVCDTNILATKSRRAVEPPYLPYIFIFNLLDRRTSWPSALCNLVEAQMAH